MNDRNHPKVITFTKDIASQLRLDSTFVNFVFSKDRPTCFRYWCDDVNAGWTCFIPDDVAVAYPLWSTNADQTLLLVTGNAVSYAKGWHDNPEIEIISQTSQGLLADLLNKVWESEASDAEMRAAAQFCGFRYLSEYLAFITAPQANVVDFRSRWRQFILRIDAQANFTHS